MAKELNNYYNITPEQVQEEVMLLSLDNIKKFPCKRGNMEDFYSMWQRFGPQAARTAMIPYVWRGDVPLPSTVFKKNGTK